MQNVTVGINVQIQVRQRTLNKRQELQVVRGMSSSPRPLPARDRKLCISLQPMMFYRHVWQIVRCSNVTRHNSNISCVDFLLHVVNKDVFHERSMKKVQKSLMKRLRRVYNAMNKGTPVVVFSFECEL